MDIVDVSISQAVLNPLRLIFSGCEPKYFRGNEGEYLIYLLRHLALLRTSEASEGCRVYENSHKPTEAFLQELNEVIRLTLNTLYARIAYRNSENNHPAIYGD